MFEKAIRLKLRFDYKDICSTEDLWDLSVKELDSIYKILNKKIKIQEEESLLETKSKDDEIIELKVNIIKYIVKTKIDESNAAKERRDKLSQKQKLLEIVAEKQDQHLREMPLEDLKKMINEL